MERVFFSLNSYFFIEELIMQGFCDCIGFQVNLEFA
jgi:hypothetical protein